MALTCSTVPSVDPLSTTIVSAATASCAATLARQVSRCCLPFQLTIMTDTSGGTNSLAIDVEGEPGGPVPGEGCRPREATPAQVASQRLVVHDPDDGVTPRRHVARIEQHR